MLEVKSIQILEKVAEQFKSIVRRKDKPVTEHPDLRMIRRHRAAEAAVKNLEQLRDRGFIENQRSSFIR